MSGKPAARVTDPTSCPLPGHGTNPIVSGSPDVFFDGLAAARMTDKSACGSPITGAVSGTVFINGLNAATLDSTGGHGNVVIGGSGTVIIGQRGGGAAFRETLKKTSRFGEIRTSHKLSG
ncbi:PAAR domain-containing protein [Pseudomonas sp. ANT_J28]|uniref:PAAR domain-containing protein n=1 Tax=Pseudomonas sp. ANT_J28 TaxID=2597352 RepID=UPI0035328017